MKDYYYLLGVNPNATATEIKKAYRKMAVVFHPDKNTSPEAADTFREITEAYSVLNDPVNRALYDRKRYLLETQIKKPAPYSYTTAPKRSRYKEEIEFMHRYVWITTWFSVIGLSFFLLLMVDYALPFKQQIVSITEMTKRTEKNSVDVHIRLQAGQEIALGNVDRQSFMPGEQLLLFSSYIFNVPIKLVVNSNKESKVRVSIYGNFVFFPILLLLCSVLPFFLKQQLELRFNAGVCSAILIVFNLILLFYL